MRRDPFEHPAARWRRTILGAALLAYAMVLLTVGVMLAGPAH